VLVDTSRQLRETNCLGDDITQALARLNPE
jgi:hypothetical protein